MPRGRPSGVPGALRACLALALLLAAPSRALVRAVLGGNCSSSVLDSVVADSVLDSVVDFADLPALFGAPVSPRGLRGYLSEARPASACQPIRGPRPRANGSLGAIALIRRYGCAFDLKVLHAQRAGFGAAVVHNVGSEQLVRMAPASPRRRRRIAIPAVFVGEAASRDLRELLRCQRAPTVALLPGAPACPAAPCGPALLAAAWTLGHGLASLALAALLLRHLGLRARGWWRRAAAASSARTQTRRKARVRVYTRRRELCAICLEQFEEGDELKILPCAHAYHCGCIDPWLARALGRSCPLCKRPVATSEDGSDSAAESLGDDGPRTPVWAVQSRLRPRAPRLLTGAPLRPRCSATALGVPSGTPGAS
ncbi:E3 ubiquitin-protein ligase ZNRF4 [Cavia porcellus]|uniref:E3 ubiquitin-protein ligase ZNRF4 n=1 Tax=Cavia porcellus TaxID=10141 RepID=UPI002FDFBDD4